MRSSPAAGFRAKVMQASAGWASDVKVPRQRASPSDVTFTFVKREDGPERLVCPRDLPSRAFGAGEERRYFDTLRPSRGGTALTKALEDAIVAAYKARASSEPTA